MIESDIAIMSDIQNGILPVKQPTIDDLFDFIEARKGNTARQIRDIVPIKEWVTSSYYLGDEAATLYPFWKDVIVQFFEGNYYEAILGGSIRSGKSHTALLITLRQLYELSCYDPIPSRFGLSSSSLILLMYLSLTLPQAELAGFGRIRRMYDQIPYFQENMPRDLRVDSVMKFSNPSVQMIAGSELGHFKGTDLFSLIFDEANFSKSGRTQKYEKAATIYRESSNRRRMTFTVDGKEGGVGIIVSSADTLTAFVEKHKENVKNDSRVLIVDSVAYEVEPNKYKDMERFWVYAGDDMSDPFLVSDTEAWNNFRKIHNIKEPEFDIKAIPPEVWDGFYNPPDIFENTFKIDPYGALQEVCGVSVGAKGRFFSNRVKFNECFPSDTENKHLFSKESIVCSYLDVEEIRNSLKPDILEFNSNFEYFASIDQSFVNDNTGIAMCHFDPAEEEPQVIFDFMLEIQPPKKPSEISPDKIIQFFVWLKEKCGAKNIKMGMDLCSRGHTIQTANLNGIDAQQLSVDKDWTQYRSLAGAILDNRVSGYLYKPFRDELFGLIQDNERKKVDHAPSGQKDVSDAVASAHWLATEALMEIKGGMRFFSEFKNNIHLANIRMDNTFNLHAGMFFGPGAFYVCWFYVFKEGDFKQVRVLSEYVDFTGTSKSRAEAIKSTTEMFGGKCFYAGDPNGLFSSDSAQISPVRELREENISCVVRQNIIRENFEIIRRHLSPCELDTVYDKHKGQVQLLLNEQEVPLMVKAFTKAKYKMKSGIKSGDLENTNEEYPLFALRFGLEEAFSEARVTGY